MVDEKMHAWVRWMRYIILTSVVVSILIGLMFFRFYAFRTVAEFPETDVFREEFGETKLIETDSAGVYSYLNHSLSGIGDIGVEYRAYFSTCKEGFVVTSKWGQYFDGDDWEHLIWMPCTRLKGTVKVGKIDSWILD